VNGISTSLALCLDAPMQSWGIQSTAGIRDTATEPTKSGIVGLLAAALGVPRDDDESIAVLAGLHLAVRVDREGSIERDFQTAQNVPTTTGTGHRTVIGHRYYLADALFLVVLHGEATLLGRVADAVQNPRWPLFLGRKAFTPTRPLVADHGHGALLSGRGLIDQPSDTVLAEHPWLEIDTNKRHHQRHTSEPVALRTESDCDTADTHAQMRHDHPLTFTPRHRRFRPRTVRTGVVPLTTDMITAGDTACSSAS
jgi:CRISPR system Cascade subunit CasD